jgi:very-short-patch-repair endonuclease
VRFRRQHDFRGYTLDFVCLEAKLVVELDGSQHADQAKYDEKRSQDLVRAGYHVIRFWNNEVFNNIEGVKETIYKKILELQPHPHPCPPLEREGEP